nr:hypothetical protein BaRGS_019562 [Batillaria attramentaria]
MTILAIRGTHQLQTEANLYVLHLAIADTLVGLGTFLGSFLYMDFSRKILDRSSVAVNFVDVPEVAARVAVLVAMSNSSMNFVIYAFRNKQFARAYRNLLNACFCRRG